jgi:hypothetical protein
MNKAFPPTYLALRAGIVAAGVLLAAACTDRRATTPTEPLPTLIPNVAGAPAAADVPKPFRLVLLQPVMTRNRDGQEQVTYATKAVYLRPVMRGEALPKP